MNSLSNAKLHKLLLVLMLLMGLTVISANSTDFLISEDYSPSSSTQSSRAVKYVNYTSTGSNNGSSWANAYTTLQAALNTAVSGDQIWVAKGTYKPSSDYGLGGGSRYYHFRMKNGVGIYGGFAGSETAVSQRLNFRQGETNETILSGDVGTTGNNSDNCYHIFYLPNGLALTSSAILDGFTIRDGYADAMVEPHCNGSAIYIYNNDPSLVNLTIVSNYSAAYGTVYLKSSNVSISNSIFKSNNAWLGGAVYADDDTLSMTNCLIVQNTAYIGGGVQITSNTSNATLTNCTICNNHADDQGGGICSSYSISVLKNCLIWGNTSVNSGNQILSYDDISLFNCCYSNAGGDILVFDTFTPTSCINSNPQFVDLANGDYRFYHTSPCVNTGNNTYNVTTTDVRGQTRIQESSIDIGALEWTSGIDPVRSRVYVKADATGNNDGSTWTDAYTSLQSALNEALPNSYIEIWVAKGTYKPSYDYGLGGGSRYNHFRLKNGLAIYGGFAGHEGWTAQRADFTFGQANETILSGDLGIVNNNSDNCYHVIFNPESLVLNNTAILDGFTIRDGNATYNTMTSELRNYGGGIVNRNASPTLRGLTFTANNARFGAGMTGNASAPLVVNCLFFGNTAVNGAAICNSTSSTPIFTNCTIVDNTASSYAGGMYNYNSSPTLNNSIIWGNNAVSGKQFYNCVGGTTTLNYSCYSNSTNDIMNTNSAINPTNCTTSNPRFFFLSPNYRPMGTSPCVNTGDNSYNTLSADIRGNVRIQDTTIDMGVYEWTAGTDPYNDIIYVKHDATGANNGSNWENAFTSLHSAIAIAMKGVQIWVARGTYRPTLNISGLVPWYLPDACFRMKNDVVIYGGFAGTESSLSQRNSFGVGQSNETILSGDIGIPGDSSDNCIYVVNNAFGDLEEFASDFIPGTIDGFTIRDANYGWGAGIYNYDYSPTIRNINFVNNARIGVFDYIRSSSLIQNCTFTGNIGAGIRSSNSSSTIVEECSFTNNQGVGIECNDASLSVNNSTFSGNSEVCGGGIAASYTHLSVTSCTFTNNRGEFNGGAINQVHGRSTNILNSYFYNNFCTAPNSYGGAIVLVETTNPTLTNCVFSNNSAVYRDGAVTIQECPGTATIKNCSFSSNSAIWGSELGVHSGSVATVNNSIIWGERNKQIILDDATLTLNYSCYNSAAVYRVNSTSLSDTNNNISAVPCFVDSTNNDVRLIGYSPCINEGNNSYNPLSTDIRGQTRIQNGIIDMGAYEFSELLDPSGSIIYVKYDATGTNNGSSWENAFTSLQSALDSAQSYSRIWVARGTYYPSSPYDLTDSPRYYHFRMQNLVSIYGGFAGTETSLLQRTDHGVGGANETILSGDIGIPGNNSDNCYHVIYNPATLALNTTAVLDGVTITRGNANYNTSSTYQLNFGGGINNTGSSPLIRNVIFTGNYGRFGGGLSNYSSASPRVVNCLFYQNTALNGAAVHNAYSSSPFIVNSTLANNTASGYGGALNNYANSAPIFGNSIIWENNAVTGKQINSSGGTATSITMNYSCYSNGTNDIVIGTDTNFVVDGSSITSDPKFIGLSSNDYRIYGNSPAVNTGSNQFNSETYDIYGRARIQNGTIDMGAFEWTTGSDPAVDPAIVTFTNGLAFTSSASNGSADQAIGRFALQTDGRTCEFNSLSVVLSGTFSGTSNYKLWESTDNSFDLSEDVLIAVGDEARGLSSESGAYRKSLHQTETRESRSNLTFSGLTTTLNGEQKYYFISCDVAGSASGSILPKLESQGCVSINGGVIQPSFSNAQLCSGSIAFLTPPENLTITEELGNLRLDWATVPGANSYKIYVSDTPDGAFTFLESTPTRTWAHLIEGDRKFYRVIASTD